MKCRSPRPVTRLRFFGIGKEKSPPFANPAKSRPPDACLLSLPSYFLKCYPPIVNSKSNAKGAPPAVGIQQLLNQRDAAIQGQRYPYPPDVMQKIDAAEKGLIPTERFAQQEEKIINGELQADKKKQ